MRALISALCLAAILCQSIADGFGRFGYRELPQIPGFVIDYRGFASNSPSADRIDFTSPARQWKAASTDQFGQVALLNSQALGPQKVKYNLWQPGFALYFEKGMRFTLKSTGCPYLTWGQGTVGEGVPTPDTAWVLISFRTAQPPILMCLEKSTASFQCSGKAGNWSLRTETPFAGWVRIIQPIGTSAVAANSATALGKLTKRVFENIAIWTQEAPTVTGLEVKGDATSVEATWTFDRPGAIVPIGAALANVGGYPIRIQSKIHRLSDWNEEGPIAVCEEPTLKIRFPVRRIPLGRSLTLGKRSVPALGTVSPIDIPSVAELGLENLLADRDATALKSAEETLAAYLEDTVYVKEPITGQQMPYAATGAGLDLAACHAFLMQTTTISNQSTSEANSLMTSVSWRRDAYSWSLPIEDRLVARRAAALASIAGFLCPENERRLEGAMFEAGLAAERGLGILRARKEGKPEPKLIEPMDGFRRFAYFRDVKVADEDAFAKSILSEIRVFGDASVSAERQGEATAISWTAADTNAHQIVFASAYPIDFELGNMNKLDVERALGLTQVRFVANQPGLCTAFLRRPEWAKDLPVSVPTPRYEEPLK
ncbi:MAG TPA: hypothetical protein VJ835_00345 [Fimbriimonadaceae bacterium]|nr:hypothetical protein [Fimbriimonadaceae bacterium]